jgi:5-methylcytosine-specific restriction endonuclease McrA
MRICVQSLQQSNCQICNSLFELKSPKHPNQKYCSKKCIRTKWKLENPVKDLESKRKYAENNREKHCVATEKYRKENQGYYREYASLRTRKVQQAKPKWLSEFDEFYIAELYDLAIKRNMQVDHIIPITNKIICGLHVPWNLQLLTKTENLRKHNKFVQDEDIVAILTGK